jgi:galactokinase/mevalonate kinase-like predicted kinase
MAYHLRIPARINILGNPSDANEGDFSTITAAVNLFAYARIEPAEKIILEQYETNPAHGKLIARQEFDPSELPLPYDGQLDLVKAAVNRLLKYQTEIQQKLVACPFKISTWTEVPRQSGLGGSTLFVLLTLGGLRAMYDLDPLRYNDYILAELTQRVEAKELGITCGYADRYAPLFGGIAYLDYRGKLHQKSLHEEPYATYERLDAWADLLSLVAVSSGIPHNSGDVHGQMRPRYIKEYDNWMRQGGQIPPMVRFMQGAWETAWRGKIALLSNDMDAFGRLMNQNHDWVDQMMTYCGFEDGAGWANNLLIKVARENGVQGAKLTGAGGGGSVFALTRPGAEQVLIDTWQHAIDQAGLTKAQIYIPKVAKEGLVVENHP